MKAVKESPRHHGCCGSHEQSTTTPAEVSSALNGEILDVRELPPARRHSLIFGTYESLKAGGSFVLVNDHDPKPLFYQFSYEKPGQFSWLYEEQGPEVWRVRIGKVAAAR